MTPVTGTKVLTNKGQQHRALDVHNGIAVGNPEADPVPLSQKWTITERPVPPQDPPGFAIFNPTSQKYLGYEGDDPKKLKLVLSTKEHLWEIVETHANLYKLEVHKIGTVCSLQSPDPNTPIVIGPFLGQNEEWTLTDTPPPPPPPSPVTGMRRIRSVAYPDRVMDGVDPLYSLAPSNLARQRWIVAESSGAFIVQNYEKQNQYLGITSDKKEATNVLEHQLWDIVPVDTKTKTFKIQIHGENNVCSLQSHTEKVHFKITKYQGTQEEWFFDEYPVSLLGDEPSPPKA